MEEKEVHPKLLVIRAKPVYVFSFDFLIVDREMERYNIFVFASTQKGSNCPSHPCTWSCIHCGTTRATCNGPSCCRISIILHAFHYLRYRAFEYGVSWWSPLSHILCTAIRHRSCSSAFFFFAAPKSPACPKKVQRRFFGNGNKRKVTVVSFFSADSTLRARRWKRHTARKKEQTKCPHRLFCTWCNTVHVALLWL